MSDKEYDQFLDETTIRKPTCYGCGDRGDEVSYIWHGGHLWHQSCCVSIGMTVHQVDPNASKKNNILFIEKMIGTNAVLQKNIREKNEKEVNKFIEKILLPRGCDRKDIDEVIKKYEN